MSVLTPEFKDYYNVTGFSRTETMGQLSIDDLKEMRKHIENTLRSFDGDIGRIDEYLTKASATSDTEVQCFIYTILDEAGNTPPRLDVSSPDLKKVLLKYREFLNDLKEFNKPTITK